MAIDTWHKRNPDVLLKIDVTRRPYSWAGDDKKAFEAGKFLEFDSSKGSEFRTERGARGNPDAKFIALDELGKQADIKYKKGAEMVWQPIDAQRVLLWAARYGRQEELAEEISKLHFEQAETCADAENVIRAVANTAELADKVDEVTAFLGTEELKDYVWDSYGEMIRHWGIKEIPTYVFNRPGTPGVFDPGFTPESPAPYVVVGATPVDQLCQVFDLLYQQQNETAGIVTESARL